MRRTQLLSILTLVILVLPLVPHYIFNENSHQLDPALPTINEPLSLSSSNSNASLQTESFQSKMKPSGASSPGPLTPDIPDNVNGTGLSRAAGLYWNKTQPFFDRDNSSDVIAILEEGFLYREILDFTRIEAFGMDVVIEDDEPLFYVDLMMNQPLFIGFHIMETVRLDGFWVLLNDKSEGWMEYAVYSSETGVVPPRPDLVAAPVVPVNQIWVDKVSGMQWIWFDIDESIYILDPAMTFTNTFFLGFWKVAANWNLQPIGLYDSTDGEDESDVYFDWGLIYWADDYLVDFVITPVDPLCDPSIIGMKVNGTSVQDTGVPGTGWWEQFLTVPINAPLTKRYYNVSLSWTTYYQWPVTFDGIWLGSYLNYTYASSRYRAWAASTNAMWTLNMSAIFPLGGLDPVIRVTIEEDWDVNLIRVSNVEHALGLVHNDWIEFEDYVQINSARNGFWKIECDAPDYMVDSEVLDMSGQVITQATGFDTVTARGYVQNQSGQNVTNGYGYVIVYDPRDALNTFNFSILQMPPGGVADINWSIWWTSTWSGVYTLHILWSNGTEVGLNLQTLEVYMLSNLEITYEFPQAGEPVIKGDIVHIEVYFENQYGFPIYDAEVTVINDSSGEEWGIGPGDSTIDYEWINWAEQGFKGYYTAFLFTDNASINKLHNIAMQLSSPFNQDQNVTKQFEVKSRATHIVFFWNGQPLPGLNNISDYWFTSPHPYINDSSLQFTIRYTDDFGLPITGAQLTPYIVHESQGVYKRLDWIELYVMDSTKPGFYNITIDTNPIAGKAFHEGDSAYIVIYASKFGYESTWSDVIDVQPQPRPTFLDVPTDFQHIILYEDWEYPTLEHPTILRVILRDALNGEDLSHGTVKAGVNGGENITLILATPGLGLYEIPGFDTENLTAGTYSVNIYAEARDFVDTITTITLTVLPKQTISYEIDTNLHLFQSPPNHNVDWRLNLLLFLENTSSSMVSFSSSKFSRQPGMTYLATGTEVTLMITAESGNYEPIIGIVGSDGWVLFEGKLTAEGEHHFYISLEGTEYYAAVSNMEIAPTSDPLYVMSISSMVAQNITLILIIAAIVILVPLGSGLAYRRYVFIPKRQQKLAKYQAIADTFSDVANLNRLLVLHKESGICVFDPFAAESQDATLVAGFLQAISTFGHDLGDSPGLAENSDEARTLRELQYEGFRILINDGQFVRVALVLNGVPSEQLRGRLETFTNVFETRYNADFEHWEGRVDQFNSASDLVEEVFLISLRHPHSVVPRKPRGAQLTSIESDIYKLSKELTKDREYIFLGQILSTYLAAAKTDKLEALMAIYQMRIKGIFLPIQLAPVPPPDVSAG